MTSSKPRDRQQEARDAGWRPHPTNSAASRAARWAFPQLTLRIWAEIDGMQLVAYVETVDEKGRLHKTEIGQAKWQPHRVTERMVVDWGRRCLEAWLATHPAVQ